MILRPKYYLVCINIALHTLLLVVTGCTSSRAAETVDGPETPDLIDKIAGYLITDDTGDITAISLPSLKTHVVRRLPRTVEGYGPIIHSLSGPDQEGRIVYIEDYFFVATEKEKRHLLKTIRIDGKDDTEIFSRPGSAMWATSAAGKGEIGSNVSLAPSKGIVAFLSKMSDKQMPRALLSIGRIEIWNVLEKTGYDTGVIALDEQISWFPDAKRFAYTKLVKRKSLSRDANGLEQFGTYFGAKWDEIPAVYIYNIDDRESTFFYVGWRPVVVDDGQTILVGGWGQEDYSWRRVNANTGESSPLNLPGATGEILGTAAGDSVVYWALPTTGSRIRYTKNNSPLSGPKLMLTVKVSDRVRGTFQTIIPYIDPRNNASYGSLRPMR